MIAALLFGIAVLVLLAPFVAAVVLIAKVNSFGEPG
ncbi:hypothetical protein J2R87_003635 [Bradyrhizobium elkanii]|nr:hypothetical protein [Bradyrhizobium elkanii]MCS4108597.1 hypothetical protein [Bradyrhizobium elkanii]